MTPASHLKPVNGAVVATRVSLGGHTYEVVPQRVGRLKKHLRIQLTDLDTLTGNIIDVGLERAHGILTVFIPDLMPLHEFLGFPSESVMNDPEGEEADDLGVTWPEITSAYTAIMQVNQFDLLSHLGKLIDPALIRNFISMRMLDLMSPEEAETPSGPTSDSSSSASTPGLQSGSTTSGTTPPTSESNAA